jgi:SNF2 family DNA or RNA helicase
VSSVVYAEIVGSSIETNATYIDKDLMRAIPGSRFSSPPPTWTVPLTWTACLQLRGTFYDRLEIGPRLREWAEAAKARVDASLALRPAVDGPPTEIPPPPGWNLRPLQRADVAWLHSVDGRGVLMNPTGSGKTASVLTWMRTMIFDNVLVVCPPIMKEVWADEARVWYPELEPVVVKGTAGERRRLIEEVGQYGGLCIMNFEAMRLHTRLAAFGATRLTDAEKRPKDLNEWTWDCVVVDEAHRMADPKAKQTRACWAVGRDAKHRVAMTATPTTKGLDTLWPILHFADPVEHPSKSKFTDRYATVSTNFWGGLTVGAVRPEMEEEFQAVIEPRTRRLPKEVALPQLPPVVRVQRNVEMSDQQAAAYDQMARLCLAEVAAGDVVTATSTAAQYTRLGQFASSYARLDTRPDGETSVELMLPSSKIDALLEDLRDWRAQEEAVAVFATSRRLLELTSEVLDRKKIKHAIIKGGQKEIERHEQIEAFQRGDVDVILVVIAAGGVGITLTRARIGAFIQRSWSRVDDTQAEGRFHRIGSEVHDSVVRVDYVTPGTVEVGQLDVLEAKDSLMQQVLRDKELIRKMVLGERIKETI